MSVLSSVHSFWANNSNLNAALPAATKVWTGVAPETVELPYALISLISSVPLYQTSGTHPEESRFQVSIWHTSLASAESIANTVVNEFTGAAVMANSVCLRDTHYVNMELDGTPNVILAFSIYHTAT